MPEKLEIYYKDNLVGHIKDGLIYSKDPTLNMILSFIAKRGWLQLKKERGLDRLQYSKNKKEFWEFLMRSGFQLVSKNGARNDFRPIS